jgi:predicted MFS family arabinose efflux permease
MAWYNLFGCFSSALGALTAGFIINQQTRRGFSYADACKFVLLIYTIIQIFQTFLFFSLSVDIENKPIVKTSSNTTWSILGIHKSKWIVFKLSILFMVDAFGGSFILQSIISDWFYQEYRTSTAKIGAMVFVCNIVAGVSALFAAKLAGIFGQIITMVFTHLPSNIFIILIPLMPNENLAILFLCLRYSISQMDVPIRNAYVQDVVDPDERSSANGVTNVVRSIGASTGPFLAGILYANATYSSYPFFIAGGLKIVYDLLLLYFMASIKPSHEVVDAEEKNAELRPLLKF